MRLRLRAAALPDLQGHKLWIEIQKSTHMNDVSGSEPWNGSKYAASAAALHWGGEFAVLLPWEMQSADNPPSNWNQADVTQE
jgi:hypothetical protein